MGTGEADGVWGGQVRRESRRRGGNGMEGEKSRKKTRVQFSSSHRCQGCNSNESAACGVVLGLWTPMGRWARMSQVGHEAIFLPVVWPSVCRHLLCLPPPGRGTHQLLLATVGGVRCHSGTGQANTSPSSSSSSATKFNSKGAVERVWELANELSVIEWN